MILLAPVERSVWREAAPTMPPAPEGFPVIADSPPTPADFNP